jgi:hypothetical protein
MPTRIVREGILTSENVNALSERAEVFYRRLMSVADDYGRFFAHPSICRAHCFPLLLDRYSDDDVKQMISECEANDLLAVYGGGKYLQVLKFGQQVRSKSKFPEPTETEVLIKCKADDKQMCSLVVSGVVSGVGVEDVSGADEGVEIPADIPSVEVAVDAGQLDEAGKFACEFLTAYGIKPERGAHYPGISALRSNCAKLVVMEFNADQVADVCGWLKSGKGEFVPKSPEAASDPGKFPKWLKMADEQHRKFVKEKRR